MTSTTLNGKPRVRLERHVYQNTAVRKSSDEGNQARLNGRNKSLDKAPKGPNGKALTGYKYKEVLSSFNEEPKLMAPVNMHRSIPLFVKDPTITLKLVKLLEQGLPYHTACRYVGISHVTFMRWLQLGSQNLYPTYTKFFKQIVRAEARSEHDTLIKLKKHQAADWRVSAWLLERRFPESWQKRDGAKAKLELNTVINVNRKEDLSKTIMNDVDAKELARKMIDGNVEEFSREATDVDYTEGTNEP